MQMTYRNGTLIGKKNTDKRRRDSRPVVSKELTFLNVGNSKKCLIMRKVTLS